MRTKQRQSTKRLLVQAGCRITPDELIVLDKAISLQPRTPRNTFIADAALDRARAILKEAGIDESTLFDKPARGTRNTRAKAA